MSGPMDWTGVDQYIENEIFETKEKYKMYNLHKVLCCYEGNNYYINYSGSGLHMTVDCAFCDQLKGVNIYF